MEKICAESDELKELQAKIKAAYLNKERTAQIAEAQFRTQQELVSIWKFKKPMWTNLWHDTNFIFLIIQEQDANIDIEYLHRKEKSDADARQAAYEKQQQLYSLKRDIQ